MKKLQKMMSIVLMLAMLCGMSGIQAAAAGEDAQVAEELQTESYATSDEVVQTYDVDASVFDDIQDGYWFHPYVSYVLKKGVMTGKGNNIFAPAEDIVRAQFAVILYRLSGSPAVTYSEKFPDVPDGQFYSKAVTWASQESVGVISGYENGKFGPENAIIREEMATMLYRYAKYRNFVTEEPAEETPEDVTEEPAEETPEESILKSYPDASDVHEFAWDAMEWAVENKIISGDNGKLNPQGRTNRAVCATMITRFCQTFMPDELKDVEMTASCKQVAANADSRQTGDFWIKVTSPKASMKIEKIQATAYLTDDLSDAFLYDLARQEDGTYTAQGHVWRHGWKFGTYQIQAWALLSNGVRLPIGKTTVQVDGTPARARVYLSVSDIYRQVGGDLRACYWWVVNNVTYKRLPVPLTPPDGYSRAEWYAIQAFEERKGNCFCYAAAFYFLAQGLGYDVQFIEGQVGMARGGYGPHGWVVIRINGASYICDPEAQREIGGHNFYMQPINSPVLRYRW